jgi:hypothetical protein
VRYDRESAWVPLRKKTATPQEDNVRGELRLLPISLLLVMPLTVVTAHADDVTGANKLLCSSGQLAVCFEDGSCDHAPAVGVETSRRSSRSIWSRSSSARHGQR